MLLLSSWRNVPFAKFGAQKQQQIFWLALASSLESFLVTPMRAPKARAEMFVSPTFWTIATTLSTLAHVVAYEAAH